MKPFLTLLILLIACPAFSQTNQSASAQQVITLRLLDITVLEKSYATVSPQQQPLKINSRGEWNIRMQELEHPAEMVKNSNDYIVVEQIDTAPATVYTASMQ